MTADYGRIEGTLEIRSHKYQLPSSAVRYWDYPAVKYLTVRTESRIHRHPGS